MTTEVNDNVSEAASAACSDSGTLTVETTRAERGFKKSPTPSVLSAGRHSLFKAKATWSPRRRSIVQMRQAFVRTTRCLWFKSRSHDDGFAYGMPSESNESTA